MMYENTMYMYLSYSITGLHVYFQLSSLIFIIIINAHCIVIPVNFKEMA